MLAATVVVAALDLVEIAARDDVQDVGTENLDELLVGRELDDATQVLDPVVQAWPGWQTLQAVPRLQVTPGLSQHTVPGA